MHARLREVLPDLPRTHAHGSTPGASSIRTANLQADVRIPVTRLAASIDAQAA